MDWTQAAMFWATAGLVLVSLFTAYTSYLLLRGSLDPHVIVYAKHDQTRPSMIVLVIENVGASLAYNVKIETDRPVPRDAYGIEVGSTTPTKEVFQSGPLVDGIPVLGPRDSRILNWGQSGGISDALGGRSIRVKCSFKSRRRFPFLPRSHKTESVLEVGSYYGTTASSPPELRLAQAVEKIEKVLSGFGSGVNRLRVELPERNDRDRHGDGGQP